MMKKYKKTSLTALLITCSVLLTPIGSSMAFAQTDSSQNGAATTTAPAADSSTNTASDATTTSTVEHTAVNPAVWVVLALALIGGIAYMMSRKRTTTNRVTVVRTDETRRP
jgi:beta-lactamase regulating signal transducer with metallopeptidase domain